MTPIQRDRIQSFHERSYFIVPGFLESPEIAELRRPCDGVLERIRAESIAKGHISPSVSLFAETSYLAEEPRSLNRLLAFVASARVCALLEGLEYGDEEPAPRLKNIDYYHEQTRHDWDGDWHRDSQFKESDPQRERALVLGTTSVHVRVALSADDRLELVEGSHRRWDTEGELRVRKGARRASADMPNAIRIALRAGDACLFHAWSIHRATYRRVPLRRTLDALYTFVPAHPVVSGNSRGGYS